MSVVHINYGVTLLAVPKMWMWICERQLDLSAFLQQARLLNLIASREDSHRLREHSLRRCAGMRVAPAIRPTEQLVRGFVPNNPMFHRVPC